MQSLSALHVTSSFTLYLGSSVSPYNLSQGIKRREGMDRYLFSVYVEFTSPQGLYVS